MLLPSTAQTVRCNKCKTMFKIPETNEQYWSEGGHGNNSGRMGKKVTAGISVPNAASPMSDSKPNPWASIGSGRHQSKRAILCGVSYKKYSFKLDGTITDVNNMKSLLVEEANHPDLIPTKTNMQKALKWLVDGCQSGDSLVFYFSGHGLRQPDFSNDELDGFDETLCPVDFKTAGMILDNDINTTIVKPLKRGVTLHAIIDSCHSGTILDLEHVYNIKDSAWVDNKPPSGVDKSTSGGLAISISACADNQMAADTSAFTGKEMAGAMTCILIQAIQAINKITYGRLLEFMHERIEDASKSGCLSVKDPQLSSSQQFDVNTTEFKL
ncbi:hypothetical protein F0562_028936 [Nyssa sinensis]|uniref:Peptidase C14 caspase domain-containing protein n=1 Tax=Nyssa sinensis TaxID=561372 RepID=A0A5J5B1I4_9ASTE|nr:hypothetical protein F0562_028936 [Nyssa sinensis]